MWINCGITDKNLPAAFVPITPNLRHSGLSADLDAEISRDRPEPVQ